MRNQNYGSGAIATSEGCKTWRKIVFSIEIFSGSSARLELTESQATNSLLSLRAFGEMR